MSSEPDSYAGSTGITLRAATASDQEFLFKVYVSSRKEDPSLRDCNAIQRRTLIAQQYADRQSEFAQQFPESDQQIVLVDGVCVGSLWVVRLEEEIRMLDVALLSEHRDQGIGTFLIRRLQAEAAETTKPLRYSVARINDGAKRFYMRLGFHVVEELNTYVAMEWIPVT